MYLQNVPVHTNCFDCGVFLCLVSESQATLAIVSMAIYLSQGQYHMYRIMLMSYV